MKRIDFKTMDSALGSMLGESAKQAIYWYFEREYGLKKEEIPEHMKKFCEFLKKFFREEGAKIIIKRIKNSEMNKKFLVAMAY